jgi:hypothetical protein
MSADEIVSEQWLSIPEVAAAIGAELRDVRALVREQRLAGVRRGPSAAYSVPVEFLADEEGRRAPLAPLRGTLIQLSDAGYSEEEAVRWLLRPDDVLGTTPVAALHAGQVHAVRRVVQGLAF